MKVTFVYPSYESLGIEYCSAMLKQRGHRTSLVVDPRLFRDTFLEVPWLAPVFDSSAEVVERVVRERPGLVALGAVTDTWRWAVATAEAVKARLDVPVVVGGVHVTSAGEAALEERAIDFVIRGEGELPLADLVDSLERGRFDPSIDNLGYRDGEGRAVLNPVRPPVEALDALPFPDKSLYDGTPLSAERLYAMTASRGCTYNCSYCNNSMNRRLYGGGARWFRRRSVANVLAELASARRRYAFEAVNFYDEIFTEDPEWLEEFCPRYAREVGLPYICCVHPRQVDERVAELLASSGCGKVDLGVQTTDPELRRQVVHRPETGEEVARAIDRLRARGVSVHAENIFGLPGQTEEQLVEAARFYNEHRPSVIKVYWLSYYPGTDILKAGLESGELQPGQLAGLERGLGSRPFATGGSGARPEFQRLFSFLAIMLLLPRGLAGWLLERRLYRWMPSSGLAGFSTILMRLLNSDSRRHDIMKRRYQRQYAHYLRRWAGGRLRTLLGCQRLEPERQP